jgi:hypothetical protein
LRGSPFATGDRGDGRKAVRRFPPLDEDGSPIRTLTAAKDALDALRANRRENKLPASGRKPGFDAFAAEYLAMQSTRNAGGERRFSALPIPHFGRWITFSSEVSAPSSDPLREG